MYNKIKYTKYRKLLNFLASDCIIKHVLKNKWRYKLAMIAISLKRAQEKLNKLLENEATLYEGEVLKLSQEFI